MYYNQKVEKTQQDKQRNQTILLEQNLQSKLSQSSNLHEENLRLLQINAELMQQLDKLKQRAVTRETKLSDQLNELQKQFTNELQKLNDDMQQCQQILVQEQQKNSMKDKHIQELKQYQERLEESLQTLQSTPNQLKKQEQKNVIDLTFYQKTPKNNLNAQEELKLSSVRQNKVEDKQTFFEQLQKNKNLQNELKEVKQNSSLLQSQLCNLSQLQNQLDEKEELCQKLHHELELTKQEKQNEIKTLNEQKDILIDNLQGLQQELEKVNLECRALKLERKNEVDELRQEMIRISQDIQQPRKSESEIQQKNSVANNMINTLRKELSQQKELYIKLKEKYDEDIQLLRCQVDDLNGQLQFQLKKKDQSDHEIVNQVLNKQNLDLQNQLNKIQTEKKTENSNVLQSLESSQSSKQHRWKQKLQGSQEQERETLNLNRHDELLNQQKLEEKLQQITQERDTLMKNYSSEIKEKQKLEKEFNELKDLNECLQKEKSNDKQNNSLQKEILKSLEIQFKQQMDYYQQKDEENAQLLEDLRIKIRTYVSTIESLKTELAIQGRVQSIQRQSTSSSQSEQKRMYQTLNQ